MPSASGAKAGRLAVPRARSVPGAQAGQGAAQGPAEPDLKPYLSRNLVSVGDGHAASPGAQLPLMGTALSKHQEACPPAEGRARH